MKCTWETSHRLVRRPAGWQTTRLRRGCGENLSFVKPCEPVGKRTSPKFSTLQSVALLLARATTKRLSHPSIFFRRIIGHFRPKLSSKFTYLFNATTGGQDTLNKLVDRVSSGKPWWMAPIWCYLGNSYVLYTFCESFTVVMLGIMREFLFGFFT